MKCDNFGSQYFNFDSEDGKGGRPCRPPLPGIIISADKKVGMPKEKSEPFSAVADSFQRIMVVKDLATPWRNDNGTLVVGLKDFLLDSSILSSRA